MRRALLALVVPAVVAALCVPCAGAKTLKVNWVERKTFPDGAFVFRVTRIDATPKRWSAVVSMRNATPRTYGVYSGCDGWSPQFVSPGLGLMHLTGPRLGWDRGYELHRARSASPAVPPQLRPGDAWRGTIRGVGPLPRGTLLRLTFGFFAPGDGGPVKCREFAYTAFNSETWYWSTDHTFQL